MMIFLTAHDSSVLVAAIGNNGDVLMAFFMNDVIAVCFDVVQGFCARVLGWNFVKEFRLFRSLRNKQIFNLKFFSSKLKTHASRERKFRFNPRDI